MKMLTHSGNTMREITEFINQNGITKEQIFSIMQTKDGIFLLNYFEE